ASNALKHGITAKTLILQNENPADLLNMLNSYVDYLQPANQIEIDLVTGMVAARWRLRRIWRYKTAQLDIEMDAQGPDLEKRFTNTTKTCAEVWPSPPYRTGAASPPPSVTRYTSAANTAPLSANFEKLQDEPKMLLILLDPMSKTGLFRSQNHDFQRHVWGRSPACQLSPQGP